MRTIRFGTVSGAALVLLAGSALAQGRGGRGNISRGGMLAGWPGGGAMEEKKGKLYVVSEATLVRVDMKTFKVELRVDLSDVGRDAAEEEKERRAWMARFDQNGDNVIDEAEVGQQRWRWLRRFDRNGDGSVTLDEAQVGPAPGASGPATLKEVDGKLVMLRGNMLFKFDTETLELEATENVLPPPEPEPEAEEERPEPAF